MCVWVDMLCVRMGVSFKRARKRVVGCHIILLEIVINGYVWMSCCALCCVCVDVGVCRRGVCVRAGR